ncbi:hypothetical protein FOL47_005716 [Perkinsus chesapeaki]|uniref:Uncharacterized protein n=1 Tax=Perkinsus chesapeaki TaxID=330153 RepID=A0A7J6LXG4_PERCH|nr:hypothetical protein FOL47_005716 [Perkinsus chesapeaki]
MSATMIAQSDSIQRAIHAAYNKRNAKGLVDILVQSRLEASPRNVATGLHRLARLVPESRRLFRSAEMNKVHACVLRHLKDDCVDPQYLANVLSACATAEFSSKSLYRYCTAVVEERRLSDGLNGQELASVLSAISQPAISAPGLAARRQLLAALAEHMVTNNTIPIMAAPEIANTIHAIREAYEKRLMDEPTWSVLERLAAAIVTQTEYLPPQLFSPRDVARLLWGLSILPAISPSNLLCYFRKHIISLARSGSFSVKALCRLVEASTEIACKGNSSTFTLGTVQGLKSSGVRWTAEDIAVLASESVQHPQKLPELSRLVETIVPFGPSAAVGLVEPFLASCWVLRTSGLKPSRRTSAGLLSLFRSLSDAKLHSEVMLLCFAWGVYPTAKDFTQCAQRLHLNITSGLPTQPAYMALIAKTLAHLCFAAGWCRTDLDVS